MTKPKPSFYSPEMELDRILRAFEGEILAATDEEIAAVASELGMKPGMKGSAAFADIWLRWVAVEMDAATSWYRPGPSKDRGATPLEDKEEPPADPGEDRTHGKPIFRH